MSVSINGAGSITGIDQGFNVTTGSVGIGTDNPAHKLDIIGGNIRVGKTSNGQFIGENNSGTVKIKLDTDGNSHLSGGNMGVGNVDPTQARLVAQTTSGSSLAAIKDNTGASIVFGGVTQPRVLLESGASASDFRIYTAGGSSYGSASWAERVRIGSGGNFSIGTTTNTNKLRVHQGSDSANIILATGADESSEFISLGIDSGVPTLTAGGVGSTSASLAFRTSDNGTESERLRLDSDGRLMIGQTSAYAATGTGTMMLTVTKNASNRTDVAISNQFSGDNGSAAIVLATHGQDYILEATGSGNTTDGIRALRILKGSDERLRIDSYGKMGINTNAPTARLDINHPHTEQGLIVRSRYGNIATAMVKFDGDPDSDGGDGNVLHIRGGSSRTDSEILHVDSTGQGTIFQIRGDGLTRVYKQLQLEHSSNVAKIKFNEYGSDDIKAQIEMDQVNGSAGQLIFRTQHGGTLSEKMRITSDGVVSMPQQVGFHMVMHTNQAPNNNEMITLWDTDASDSRSYIKNCTFNAGRFVAPVAGLYYFTAQLLLMNVGSNDDNIHIAWTTGSGNDTFAYWNTRHDGASANGSYGYGGYLPVCGSTTVYLTANQIFGMRINYTGDIDVYGTDKNWGHWSGFLVG